MSLEKSIEEIVRERIEAYPAVMMPYRRAVLLGLARALDLAFRDLVGACIVLLGYPTTSVRSVMGWYSDNAYRAIGELETLKAQIVRDYITPAPSSAPDTAG